VTGYHMAVVAGVVFFALRALLALFSAFANRYPIKKWVFDVPASASASTEVPNYQGIGAGQGKAVTSNTASCYRIG
jgi:hypothetical protein